MVGMRWAAACVAVGMLCASSVWAAPVVDGSVSDSDGYSHCLIDWGDDGPGTYGPGRDIDKVFFSAEPDARYLAVTVAGSAFDPNGSPFAGGDGGEGMTELVAHFYLDEQAARAEFKLDLLLSDAGLVRGVVEEWDEDLGDWRRTALTATGPQANCTLAVASVLELAVSEEIFVHSPPTSSWVYVRVDDRGALSDDFVVGEIAPEPGTLLLIGMGAVSLLGRTGRRDGPSRTQS